MGDTWLSRIQRLLDQCIKTTKVLFSILLLAVCDTNYCFTYTNVGCQRRISNSGIFNQCSLTQKFGEDSLNLPPPEPLAAGRKPVPYVVVVDNTFALEEHMMNPYSREDSKILGPSKEFSIIVSHLCEVLKIHLESSLVMGNNLLLEKID